MAGKTWRSLGAAIHYQTHLRLQLAEDPDFPLPELAGSWFISTEKRGSTSYPAEGLVYAIDRRAGVTDLQVELDRRRQEEIKRLSRALRTLREFDELLQDWLTKAWELLALVLAPREVIQSALAQGAVWRRAHDWLQERRNGHGS